MILPRSSAGLLNKEDYDAIVGEINRLENRVGVLAQELALKGTPQPSKGYFMAVITDSQGADGQYTYSWVEAVKTDAGYVAGSWSQLGDGRTGNKAENTAARNAIEYTSVAIEPVDAGSVVQMITFYVDGVIEHWFFGVVSTVACSTDLPVGMSDNQGVQDADIWDREEDNTPITLDVITDIQYDTSTHLLQYRTRTLSIDSCGRLFAIGAESELVTIDTAESCVA